MTALAEQRVPIARAARLTNVSRGSWYYAPRTRAPAPVDAEVRESVLGACRERPSFGYRRVTALVRAELARPVNEKRVRRIMRTEGLTLEPCVQPRHRIRRHPGRQITDRPDEAYQMDMVHVWCGFTDGWAYLQNVIDCCTSEWLAYAFSKRCGAREAVQCLDRLAQERFPGTFQAPSTRLRVDNGTAYRSQAFLDAARRLGFHVEHIQVQTPEDNGVVESLHAGLERDYFRHRPFDSFMDAQAHIAWAHHDYNTRKPMKRLGWRTPKQFHDEVTTHAR